MYLAVIGDIMSNFSGLTRILESLEEQGIHRVIQTGNLSQDGLHLSECIRLLRMKQAVCVQGRHDRAFVRGGRGARKSVGTSGADAPRHPVDSASIEYLNTLPRRRVVTEEGLRIVVCHGSINSAGTLLDSQTPRAVFQRQRELEPADIIVSGGAPEPFSCTVDRTLFVIPGTITTPSGAVRYTFIDTEVLPPSVKTVTL